MKINRIHNLLVSFALVVFSVTQYMALGGSIPKNGSDCYGPYGNYTLNSPSTGYIKLSDQLSGTGAYWYFGWIPANAYNILLIVNYYTQDGIATASGGEVSVWNATSSSYGNTTVIPRKTSLGDSASIAIPNSYLQPSNNNGLDIRVATKYATHLYIRYMTISYDQDTAGPTTPGTPDLAASDDTGYSSIDNITRNSSGLTFSWSSSTDSGSGVAGYEWRLDTGSWSALMTATSADISAGAGSHTFYVRAKDNAGNYSSSSSLGFTVDTTAPGIPSLSSPADGASTRTLRPTLSWGSVSGAYRYHLTVSDGNVIGAGDEDQWTTSTSFAYSYDMQEDTWSWNVLAEDAAGNQSSWSVTRTFTVTQPLPSKVTSPNLPNGSISQPLDLSLSWQNGGGAVTYDVYIGTSPSSLSLASSDQTGTTYTLGRRDTGTAYYWRVDAKSSGGTTTGDIWSFTTCGNSGSGPDRGNTTKQEYGDAIYQYLLISGYNYNHTGIFAGIDSSKVSRAFESLNGDEAADPNNNPAQGPQEGRFDENFINVNASVPYYGAYIPSSYTGTMPFSDRRAVVGKGRQVVDQAGIEYSSALAGYPAIQPVSGWSAPLDVSQIRSIRCDGLVEYAYEASGIRIWRNALLPDDQWNIAYYPENHNNFPGNTRDPHFEASPWAQRGAPPATGPIITWDQYSGPPWPDTRMTKPSVINLPTCQLILLTATTDYADVQVRATDESGIYQITHTKPDGAGAQQYKVNPERHPSSDTWTTPTVRLVRLPGNTYYQFSAAAQDHGGNWGNTMSANVYFLPYKVTSPTPSNGSTGRSINQTLSWANGGGATSYDVYFGASNPPTSLGNQPGTSYNPGTLAFNTTYYWRIDANNSEGTTQGDVWSFATESEPPRGTLQMSAATYEVNENGASVTITVTRQGGSYGATSVSFASANGTALAGSDFTTANGTLSWADGDNTAKTITISILNDALLESNEVFTVNLSGVSGAALGSQVSTTVTIYDDEASPPGTVQLSAATYSVNESGGSVTITATRTGGSFGAASVNYATANGTAVAGSDFTGVNGKLSWAAGDSASKTITIPIVNDTVFESNELFTVTLSGATGASLGSQTSANVTIVDDEVVLTVAVNPVGAGSVSGGGIYVVGSNAFLSATASNLWRFIAWDDGNTNASRTVVMPAGGATYTANFAPVGLVTVQANPTNAGSATGGGLYLLGSNATVTATASNSWLFMNWNGAVTNNPWTFQVVSNGLVCTANFARSSTVTVLASPTNGGSVAGGGSFLSGTNIPLTAAASTGWRFVCWSDGVTNNPRMMLVPDAATNFTALFATLGALPGTNILANGSFESPAAASNQWYQGDFSFVGWNGVQVGGAGLGLMYGTSYGLVPLHGQQHFVMNGASSPPAGSSIEQFVGTVSGVVYEVSFGAGRCGDASALKVQAQVTGATTNEVLFEQLFLPSATTGYTTHKFFFTANGSLAKLRFTDQSAANVSADLFLDNVSLSASARTVTVLASPATGGSVSGGGLYFTGTNVTLTAVASNNWMFTKWNDNTTTAVRVIVVPPSNITYTANFSPAGTVAVGVNTNAGGSVTGSGTFMVGSNALLTATASNGWRFIRWNDNATNNPRTVIVKSNVTYTAVFAPTASVIVQANPVNGGGVSGGGTYVVGSTALLTAAASNTNWRFIGWNDGPTNSPRTVVVQAGTTTYTANFAPLGLVTVLVRSNLGGRVSGGGQYILGSNASVTATASNSWLFANWNGVVTNNPWTFPVSTSNIVCTAAFVRVSAVNVTASPAYAGTISGGGSYLSGSNIVLAAVPAPGWLFSRWNDGLTNASRTLTVPVAPVSYTAFFTMGLGAALNLSNQVWATGGHATWAVQTATSRDGAAVRSGTISHNQETWLQTTTNGPGSLLFWWKVSSEANDGLEFYAYSAVQTQTVARLSGSVDWQQYACFLGTTNTYTLKWRYVKNGAVTSGSDAGWVDQVEWLASPYATNVPQILFQAASGMIASWILDTNAVVQYVRFPANTGTTQLKCAGDIDGNGTADLLFQGPLPAGTVSVWFMSADGSVLSNKVWGNNGQWELKACIDYEGLGHAQVFQQTPQGTAAYWRLDTNGVFQAAVILGNMGGWRLRGGGDLDRDGKAEIIWQTAAGLVAIWYHNPDGSIRGHFVQDNHEWALCGTVDVDNDGTTDLIWQTPDYRTGGWIMKSGTTNCSAREARFWWPTGGWKLKAAGR